MPIKNAAYKALRKSEARKTRNSKIKDNIFYQEKQLNKSIAAKNKEGADKQYQVLSRLLDKACGKGVLKKNTVARRKSRLAKKLKF